MMDHVELDFEEPYFFAESPDEKFVLQCIIDSLEIIAFASVNNRFNTALVEPMMDNIGNAIMECMR